MTDESRYDDEFFSFDGASTEPTATSTPTGADEPGEAKVVRPGLSGNQKLMIALSGIALALIVGILIGAGAGAQGANSEAPTDEGESKIPAGAELFVEEYGSRYDDPISVYYANYAHEEKFGNSLIMTNDFIANYDKSAQRNQVSNLGFERYMLPKSTEMAQEQQTSRVIFNGYAVKQLDLYMNLLAMNPTPEAHEIIDFEFENYCSYGNTNTVPESNNMESLKYTLKSIVDKYGSAAIYSVGLGSTQQGNPDISYFSELMGTGIVSRDEDGLVNGTQDTIIFVVHVDKYDGPVVSHDRETIKNFEFSVIRQAKPDYDFAYISIGQSAIR